MLVSLFVGLAVRTRRSRLMACLRFISKRTTAANQTKPKQPKNRSETLRGLYATWVPMLMHSAMAALTLTAHFLVAYAQVNHANGSAAAAAASAAVAAAAAAPGAVQEL